MNTDCIYFCFICYYFRCYYLFLLCCMAWKLHYCTDYYKLVQTITNLERWLEVVVGVVVVVVVVVVVLFRIRGCALQNGL